MRQITVTELVEMRNVFSESQRKLYVAAVTNINMKNRELLTNDFGNTLLKNCARDIAGDFVRRFFDLSDYYVTVDQLAMRLFQFSYDSDYDFLASDESIRKMLYNMSDSPAHSRTLQDIAETVETAQTILFTVPRKEDTSDSRGRNAYRKERKNDDGTITDELTGERRDPTEVQADHVQPRASARYNERYIRKEKVATLQDFYNSEDNMAMIDGYANDRKSDVRVCERGGKIEYLTSKQIKERAQKGINYHDITSQATPEQLAEATIFRWESAGKDGKQKLIDRGYLDENGKVTEKVKGELIRQAKHSQNVESRKILEGANYKRIGGDALHHTSKSLSKIIAGQVIYYVLPPTFFEAKQLIRQDRMTFDRFLVRLKQAGSRIIRYAQSRIGEMLRNIVGNSLNKFLKSFFDILIEMVKATVKRIIKVLKQLVLALASCVKTIADPRATGAQKVDAVTKTVAVTINGVVIDILFEFLEKQFGLPGWLMEILQITVTALSTNAIMLILQKVDLFDAQYGLLVSNIEAVFAEEHQQFLSDSEELLNQSKSEMNAYMDNLKEDIEEIKRSLSEMDFFQEDATADLERLNKTFEMGIDFCQEWQDFCQTGATMEVNA